MRSYAHIECALVTSKCMTGGTHHSPIADYCHRQNSFDSAVKDQTTTISKYDICSLDCFSLSIAYWELLLAIVIDVVYSFHRKSTPNCVCSGGGPWLDVCHNETRETSARVPDQICRVSPSSSWSSVHWLFVLSAAALNLLLVYCFSPLRWRRRRPLRVSAAPTGLMLYTTSTFNYSRSRAPVGATDDDNFSNSASFLFFIFAVFDHFPVALSLTRY